MNVSVSDLVLPEGMNDLSNQIRLLILDRDIEQTSNEEQKRTKRGWYSQWTELFLSDAEWLSEEEIRHDLQECDNKLHGGIVLVELVNFSPYTPLFVKDGELTDEQNEQAKKLNKCKLDETTHLSTLGEVSTALGFEEDYPKKLKGLFKDAAHQLQGGWTKTIAYTAAGAVVLAIGGAIAATALLSVAPWASAGPRRWRQGVPCWAVVPSPVAVWAWPAASR